MFAMLLLVASAEAFGHGALANRKGCVLSIGPYQMYFTGYQPRTQGSTEFCDDVPDVAQTQIVLDYVDRALRPTKVGLRIVRNINLAGKPEYDGETVVRLSPRRYPGGTIRLVHRYTESGYFVGIVTVTTPSGEEYVARFPFSVGKQGGLARWAMWLALPLLLLLVGGGLLWRYSRRPAPHEI